MRVAAAAKLGTRTAVKRACELRAHPGESAVGNRATIAPMTMSLRRYSRVPFKVFAYLSPSVDRHEGRSIAVSLWLIRYSDINALIGCNNRRNYEFRYNPNKLRSLPNRKKFIGGFTLIRFRNACRSLFRLGYTEEL